MKRISLDKLPTSLERYREAIEDIHDWRQAGPEMELGDPIQIDLADGWHEEAGAHVHAVVVHKVAEAVYAFRNLVEYGQSCGDAKCCEYCGAHPEVTA